MSKRELLKAMLSAAVFSATSYILVKFVLEKYLPAPDKKSNMTGMGACNCQQAWPYGRQG